MHWIKYPVPVFGTIAVFVAGWLLSLAGRAWAKRNNDRKERFRRQKMVNTAAVVLVAAVAVLLWSRVLQHTSTFLGLIGAGLAVALREPLLSIAGRIAIFAGHIYGVGDRIQIDKMSGDVIDVGTFYTRMMEIGNWVGGDQPSGRIVQFANASIFGTPVYNYTQNFSYIWDEIKFQVTYDSDFESMKEIMLDAGSSYTKEFLHEAEEDLQRMRKYFLVPSVDLKPAVYIKVTDNWIEMTMRYIVNPKKRRVASTYLYTAIFTELKKHDEIQLGSSTMDLTVHPPEDQNSEKRDDERPREAA